MTEIKLDIKGPIASLTLNRPQALNALTPSLLDELDDALDKIAGTHPRVVVIRGNGKAFCAGADLKFVTQAIDDFSLFVRFTYHLNRVLFRFEALPQPVVAIVHGFALAGGMELMLACDFVLAADDARIGDQHANIGLMPGGGATQRLVRKIGYQKALELLLTGRWIDGREAERLGLVLRASPAAQLDRELEALVSDLVNKSPTGLGQIKRAVMLGRDLPLRNAIGEELLHLFEYFASSSDPKEGIQTFINKPNFTRQR